MKLKTTLSSCLVFILSFLLMKPAFADVTYTTEPVAAANMVQGSTNNIVYMLKMDVTTTAVTADIIQFTLSGTHDNNDLTNYTVYINSTPSLTGAANLGGASAAFAAPTTYNYNFVNQAIAAGTTRYFIITVNTSASGTNGNTVKVDGAANPVTITYTTAPTIINNQTDAAGAKTIQNAGVTYSSEPVAAANMAQGSTNNIVYMLKMDVTTTAVTADIIQFTLSGTHDNNDLTNYTVYINSTPSLTGAANLGGASAAFAAPTTYNYNFVNQAIAAGTTRYFIITVNTSASGTNGNTVKVDGAANPVTITYTTAPTIINNQTDAAGAKTIQNAGVTYSSEPVAAANMAQGSTGNIVYIAKVDVTTLPVATTSMSVPLGGTHDNNDLTNISVYTNTTPSLTGATQRTGVSAAFAAPQVYNLNYSDFVIGAGTTLYFIVTVDVNASGTGGNTVKVNGATNPVSFTYITAPTIINNQTDAAGAKTIQNAGVTYSSEPVAAANMVQGSTGNIVYIAKVDVTTLPVATTSMSVPLGGTHDNNDLTNISVYTNTTPSLTGATQRTGVSAAFAAPQVYNLNYSDFVIGAGTTLYFIVTVDVNASGTGGNTVKVNGATNPVSFTYITAPTIVNNQTDAAGAKTIQNADVTYSSEPVPAGNMAQGSTGNIVYIAKVDVTTLPVTTTSMSVPLGGTHDNNDLTNISVYTNSTPSLSGATLRNGVSAAFAAPQLYTLNYSDFSIAAGTTLYFIVTVNVNASGTGGNTVKVDGAANPVTFTYTTAPTIINNQTDAAGAKTIQNNGVTYSSEPVPAGNMAQGSTGNIVYIAKVDVTTLPVTTTSISVPLGGTHDNNDLTNISVYTNSTPSLTGAFLRNGVTAAFAAPQVYTLNYSDFSIAAGTTLYFIVTVNVNDGGTGGNTVKVDGAANPVTFTYTTAPTITNNQTDIAGVKTIQAAGVAISSETIAASNITLGSSNNIIYMAKLDITTLPVTATDIQFTLSGTHDNDDLTNVRIYSNTAPSLSGATSLATVAATFAAPTTYNVNIADIALPAGSTRYILIAVDVNASGSAGNTVTLNGLTNPVSFTYSTGPIVTNNQTDAAGAKTIGTTLPLTLVHFTASSNSQQQTSLQWTTAGEINTSNFEVEWGTDGVRFSTVGTLSAAGNSLQQKQYGYLHNQPAAGLNFYRLKMTDVDGRFTYSPIVKATVVFNKMRIAVYPNPVVSVMQLTVQAVKDEAMQLRLYNAAGKQVASKIVTVTKGTNRLYWNLEVLAAGVYYITPSNGLFETITIIKTK